MTHKTAEEGIACADHFTFHTTKLQAKSRSNEFASSSFQATKSDLKDDALPTFFKNKNLESKTKIGQSKTKIGQKRSNTGNNSSLPNNETTLSGNS